MLFPTFWSRFSSFREIKWKYYLKFKNILSFQEVNSNVTSFRNLQTSKQQLSALPFLKNPEIKSAVEFLSSEAGSNEFSTE